MTGRGEMRDLEKIGPWMLGVTFLVAVVAYDQVAEVFLWLVELVR